MNLSFVISTQPTRFHAATFSPDFEANVARLAELGYDGVELAVREPAQLDVGHVHRVLDKYHLQVPAIGTGQAWGEERLSFTDPDPGVRARAMDRIQSHLPLAREFGALVILGLIRGTLQPEISREQVYAWLLAALQEVAQAARDSGVRLAIEPINRYETTLLNTVADTIALIKDTDADNVGVLYDTFHSNIEESDMLASMRACGKLLYHVHLADSNRWSPGSGHTDFGSIIATLRDMQYPGWVSAEILPQPDIAAAQEQTAHTMKPLLK